VSGLINLVMLPMFVTSGVFFSTARFPDGVQPLFRILPLTALNDALRAVMMTAAGCAPLSPQCALLAGTARHHLIAALRGFAGANTVYLSTGREPDGLWLRVRPKSLFHLTLVVVSVALLLAVAYPLWKPLLSRRRARAPPFLPRTTD